MSFFKDFKDDLSQAVNELMPEESVASAAPVVSAAPAMDIPQMVDTISEPAPALGTDDIASLLNNLEAGNFEVPAAEPVFEETVKVEEAVAQPQLERVVSEAAVEVAAPEMEIPPVTPVQPVAAPVEAPIQAPVEAAIEPVVEAPVEIPVYQEAAVAEPVVSKVEPVFAPEPPKVEVPKEPVAPVFAPEPVKEEVAKEPVMPVFAPEPPKVEEPKAPVTPVFAPESPSRRSAPINSFTDGSNEVGVIPKGMTIVGDITSNGSLDIMGTVKGNVTVAGKLNITGNIEGNSTAEEVFADGARIIGEITSNGTIKVGQSSVIKGNIVSTSAVLAGAVKGDIDVKGPVVLDSTAIIMGNIKSKSIQINNGAAIEGLCSQCYAEVSPASFFTEG